MVLLQYFPLSESVARELEGVWIQWNGMVEWNIDKLDGFNGFTPPFNDHLWTKTACK